jgi:hypothetical protein
MKIGGQRKPETGEEQRDNLAFVWFYNNIEKTIGF